MSKARARVIRSTGITESHESHESKESLEFVLKAEVSEDTLSTGDQVLYCIRSDETGLVWRPAQVISTSNGVSLCVTVIPLEACAAGARVTKREQWTLHGYVFGAEPGVGVGQYRKL